MGGVSGSAMTQVAFGRTPAGRDVMFGRYRLLGRIAAGGMAEVWAAQLLAAGGFCKSMVIKRVLPELAENPSFLRMLMTEARVAARLSHTNICSVFELGEVEGEYERGGALAQEHDSHSGAGTEVGCKDTARERDDAPNVGLLPGCFRLLRPLPPYSMNGRKAVMRAVSAGLT